MTSRLEQKNDLLIKLGMLFRPLVEMVESTALHDPEARSRVLARYAKESLDFMVEMNTFSQEDPGYRYEVEAQRVALAVRGIVSPSQHPMVST